jgi:two-component system chemotaxis response regulator CheB
MNNFPWVCVGGSAGGLNAYIRLLTSLPADMGVAIVIVNHITKMPTQLHEMLPRFSRIPVELIKEDLLIEPNHVYIIPNNRDLHVDGEVFHLKPISKPCGWPDVITVFLKSLTQFWDGKLIAVIVPGFDGDGAEALCSIKVVGGITMAQKLDTARQPDMPTCRSVPLRAVGSTSSCRWKTSQKRSCESPMKRLRSSRTSAPHKTYADGFIRALVSPVARPTSGPWPQRTAPRRSNRQAAARHNAR